jgi:hypothetical protein
MEASLNFNQIVTKADTFATKHPKICTRVFISLIALTAICGLGAILGTANPMDLSESYKSLFIGGSYIIMSVVIIVLIPGLLFSEGIQLLSQKDSEATH